VALWAWSSQKGGKDRLILLLAGGRGEGMPDGFVEMIAACASGVGCCGGVDDDPNEEGVRTSEIIACWFTSCRADCKSDAARAAALSVLAAAMSASLVSLERGVEKGCCPSPS